MWNDLDKVTRFALVMAAVPTPIMVGQLMGTHPDYVFVTLLWDIGIVGFFWALAQGLKAVFIPRR